LPVAVAAVERSRILAQVAAAVQADMCSPPAHRLRPERRTPSPSVLAAREQQEILAAVQEQTVQLRV
jgi:hypothetical protein